MQLTGEQVLEASKWWKGQLGLQSWNLDIRRVPYHEVDGNLGQVYWTLSKMHATVKLIMHDQLPDRNLPEDDELILVHELIHITWAALHDHVWDELNSTQRDVYLEQQIHLYSILLVKMRRNTGHKFSWEEEPAPEPCDDMDPSPRGAD